MINNFSSEEEILKCIADEERKAFYWAEKKLGSDRGVKKLLANRQKWEKLPDHEVLVTDCIKYTAPSGNEWHTVLVVHEVEGNWINKDWNTFVLYQTNEGIGIIMGSEADEVEDDYNNDAAICFCPPVFDILFDSGSKIIKDKQWFLDRWIDFLKRNPRYTSKVVEENGKKTVYIAFNEWILMGSYESRRYWRMWDIKRNEEWQKQTSELDELIKDQEEGYKDYLMLQSAKAAKQAVEDKDSQLPLTDWVGVSCDVRVFIPTLMACKYVDKAEAESLGGRALFIMDAILRMTGENVSTMFFNKPDPFIVQEAKKLKNLYDKTPDAMTQTMAESMLKVMWHYNINKDLPEVTQFLMTYERWQTCLEQAQFIQTTNPRDNMDKKMQESLRSTLKQFGLRDKFENLVKTTRTTYASYLDWVQPIYAITRMRPYIDNDKDRAKFKEADMYWLEFIVNNDRCSQLDGYVKKYGKRGVIQAIRYLVDNDIWSSPLGIEGLRKPMPEHFKGLEAIEEAVQYLKGEGIFAGEEEKDKPEVDTSGTVTETEVASATGVQTKAQTACKRLRDHFEQMQVQVAAIEKYIGEDELVEMLEEENKKLTKDNEDLRESIKTVNRQLTQAQKDIKRHEEDAYNARKERDEKKKSFDEIMAKYVQQQKDYDALKQMAKEAEAIPKAKIIPLSKLEEIPLVGKTVLYGLIPFLKKYNIVVDERK